jgi:uncharacterized protein
MSKGRTHPLKVNLRDLPQNGREFSYDLESGELNEIFADIIGVGQNYSVAVHIKPIGNAFELTGSIQTTLLIPCALCGLDLELPIFERLREILVVASELPRDGHEAKVNHVTELESGPSSQMLTSDVFELGEFLQEILALAEPTRLTKGADCEQGLCPEVQTLVKNGALVLDSEKMAAKTYKPFESLERLKLKS